RPSNASFWAKRRSRPSTDGGFFAQRGVSTASLGIPTAAIPPSSPTSSPHMICVAIGRSRHKHIMAEHQHLAEQGAKMVELRLDYVAGKVNIRRLMAGRPEGCQVIITCRRKEDGGKWPGSEEARLLLLREAIAEGVDYVDLEEDVAGQI